MNSRLGKPQSPELNRVLLDKLTVSQLVKKFPVSYATQRFIIMFITAFHWILPRYLRIHSTFSHTLFKINFFSPMHSLPNYLLPWNFLTKMYSFLIPPMHATCSTYLILLNFIILKKGLRLSFPKDPTKQRTPSCPVTWKRKEIPFPKRGLNPLKPKLV
jgi:hypothetical protein